jgi:rubredoxin
VKHFNNDDTRTFGLCFGIKTRKKSEVFSSILIQKRYLLDFLGVKIFPVYDILCAKDFNPNERTGEVFSRSNPRFILPEQVRRSILKYHQFRRRSLENRIIISDPPPVATPPDSDFLHQCKTCLTVYNELIGESDNNIVPGTAFDDLPEHYCCTVCEERKDNFVKIDPLALQVL